MCTHIHEYVKIQNSENEIRTYTQVVANDKNNLNRFHFRFQRNLEVWTLIPGKDAPSENIQ